MVDKSAELVAAADLERERINLRPLREHRVFIMVFVLSAMLSALALTYIYSERYRTEVAIFLKPSDVTELTRHTREAFGSSLPNLEFRNMTLTIDRLVGSDLMLRRIVTKLQLDIPEPRDLSGPWYMHVYKVIKYAILDSAEDAWQILRFGRLVEDPVSQAVDKLRKQIKISNDESYLYTLRVTGNPPQRVAAIADEVGVTLVNLLHDDDQRSFDKRSKQLRAMKDKKTREIEDIEEKIRDLLANNGVASIKDELEKITDRASNLQRQRVDARADLRQSEAKVAGFSEKLRVPDLSLVRDSAPSTSRGSSRINAEDYVKLTSGKLEAEVNSAAFRGRLDALDRSYAAMVPRLQLLTQIQAEYDVLSTGLTSAKRDVAALSDAAQELEVRATSGQSELRILSEAATPAIPVSPIIIYHIGAAGLLAALIAFGLAYVLDYFDIRLFLPPAGGRRPGRRRLLEPAPESGMARVSLD